MSIELNNKNINNKKFLEYFKNNCKSNMNFIKSISFNKKSISIKLYDINEYNLIFNSFFDENTLYRMILRYLSLYIKDNNLNLIKDFDYYEYKFKKLNIK